MTLFRSYRSKLQASLLILGLLAIAVTYWQASAGATAALRQTTYDRLTSIRETKRRLVEDYFHDLTSRVLALSTDESSVAALEHFRSAWDTLPQVQPGDPRYNSLARHYRETFAPTVAHQISELEVMRDWFPGNARTRGLQYLFISGNPHPTGAKDLLLEPEQGGAYGTIHARYHPTFHRYQTAFGLYDLFLIDARQGRILYSVLKEIDLGAELAKPPYQLTALARAYARVMAQAGSDDAVIEDYAPYVASQFAPAAFVAAPIRRAGARIGILAIQVSIGHVNRVMTGDRNWQGEGLGRTGNAYIVASDRTLRSDLRLEIEKPDHFFSRLRETGVSNETIDRIQRDGTAILNLALPAHVGSRIHSSEPGAGIGADFRGAEVIRSHSRLKLPGLDWTLVAEMETEEAFAPIAALSRRLLATGMGVAVLFVAAAWVLSRSVTKPVLALVEGARRLGGRDFGVRLPVRSSDEIGQLAESFNGMAERLQQTTVSRDELSAKQRELQALNTRLIGAQEEERSRLARELHDDLTQRLAAVAIAAGALKQTPEPDVNRWRSGLNEIQREMGRISEDIHGLSRRLHSATLEDLGLVAAIEGECRGFFERGGPPVEFTHNGRLETLDKDVQLAIYRITQEALRNTFRHAEATEVSIHLTATAEEVVLTVEDNGCGYDPQRTEWRPGVGLASMNERARLLGGTATITSRPGAGTRVTARLPAEAHK